MDVAASQHARIAEHAQISGVICFEHARGEWISEEVTASLRTENHSQAHGAAAVESAAIVGRFACHGACGGERQIMYRASVHR